MKAQVKFGHIMNFVRLSSIVRDKKTAVEFLQQHGILHMQRFCDNGHWMQLYLGDKEDRWRCNTRDCRQQKQLKAGTWLSGAHLKLETVVYFIYWWSQKRHLKSFASMSCPWLLPM